MLCHTLKAGRVAAHFAAWRHTLMTNPANDKLLLSDVLGAAIECTVTPGQHKLPNEILEYEYHNFRQEVHH